MPPTTHSLISPSALHRVINCPPSVRLTEGMDDESTSFAEEGTAAHELGEWKIRKALKMQAGRRPSSEYWSDEMEQMTDEYREYVVELFDKAKQACNDPIPLIETKFDLNCYIPDGKGTSDFALVAQNELTIVDLKYGRGVAVYADHNPQMMMYALGVLGLFDCLYDIKQVTMVIFQPRLGNVSIWTTPVNDLYEWADEVLKPAVDLAMKGEGNYSCGSWCRFCKARNTCRARAESFLELAKYEFQPPALLSDEEVAEVMDKGSELSAWVSDVIAYASAQAIENGKHYEGYKVVAGRSVRKFTDEKKVEAAAKEAGYSDIYSKSLITLTAFEKLMGKEVFQEVLGAYVTKPQGKLTLVPVSDKRPEVDVNTVDNDFNESED